MTSGRGARSTPEYLQVGPILPPCPPKIKKLLFQSAWVSRADICASPYPHLRAGAPPYPAAWGAQCVSGSPSGPPRPAEHPDCRSHWRLVGIVGVCGTPSRLFLGLLPFPCTDSVVTSGPRLPIPGLEFLCALDERMRSPAPDDASVPCSLSAVTESRDCTWCWRPCTSCGVVRAGPQPCSGCPGDRVLWWPQWTASVGGEVPRLELASGHCY